MNRIVRQMALAGLLLCGSLSLGLGAARAQCVSLNAVDVPAQQDFDALSNTAGSTTNALALPGWSLLETGGSARDNEQYAVDTGAANTGDTYSYGSAGSTDRALGSLRSGTLVPTFGACYTNNTGAAIQSLDITYTGEQWRLGTAARADRIDFQYSLNATDLATGAWTDVDALDFSTPNTATVGAKDGNAAENRTALSATVSGLSIPNGATFWIRWNDTDASGADDGLAIDGFSLIARGQGGGGTPVLSISDTAAPEGDSGTTEFMFTLSLTAPAGPGGVSIQYFTRNDTAGAPSDFVAVPNGSATIPEGQTSIVIGVLVNGDTVQEPDENFHVLLDGATGAIIADGLGIGTIQNDDVSITPIHDVQGPGAASPLATQPVTTSGIVTARKYNGFYLQAPEAEYDADPATSEGVFVFTSAAPPAQAAVGNRVIVSGTVTEYRSSNVADPASLTEITAPTVLLSSTGNPLPAPIVLTTTFPNPTGAYDQLERVEGMRVSAPSVTVIAPTGGSTSEPNATGGSNGKFYATVTGLPRPFREPGIQAPDSAPGGGSIPPIPRWDGNPEVFAIDSDSLGAAGSGANLSTGAVVQNLVGTLDYFERRYIVDALLDAPTPGMSPQAARAPTSQEFTYAAYNVERFFDTVNDPGIGEPVLTPTAFANRLNKLSLGIRDYLRTPDILGLVEVENLSTLQAIATKVNADAVAAGQPDPQYAAYLMEGNDVGGIDVGFLVKSAEVAAGTPRVEVVAVTQQGASTTWNDPNGGTPLLNDRPPLQLDAVVHFADGRAFPITAIAVHQRSLIDVELDTAAGNRVRMKRQAQAAYLAGLIQGLQNADPTRRILVAGDFNAFEFNDGLADVMGTTTGMPSPDNATAVPGDGVDLVDPDLLNLFLEEPADQRYSYTFDGSAQSIDHILVNQALGVAAGNIALDHARINGDFPQTNRSDANSASRLSDHDPAIAYVSVATANLAIEARALQDAVTVGDPMTFTATVLNYGPDDAAFPGAGFAFDAELPDMAVTAPNGWTCDAPEVTGGNTSVACAASSLADGAEVDFEFTADAPASSADETISMAASVDAATFDPYTPNNQFSASVSILDNTTDLSVAIEPQSFGATHFYYAIVTRNIGPRNTTAMTIRVSRGRLGDAPLELMNDAGWSCSQEPTAFVCTLETTLGPGSIVIGPLFGVLKRNHKSAYRIRASVTGPAPDPNMGNNSAIRALTNP